MQRLHPDGGWLQPLCTEAERLRPLQPGLPPYALQVRLNRGLLGVAQGQCEAAAIDFDAVVQIEPTNAVAANNFAVCQLYCCELTKAITYLEGFVKADPHARTPPAIAANLAALYQMTDGAAASKLSLERLVIEYATDDFDVSALTPLA